MRAQTADRGLCQVQRRAQVVADRCGQRRPHPVGFRQPAPKRQAAGPRQRIVQR
jgi:hypothetical protein